MPALRGGEHGGSRVALDALLRRRDERLRQLPQHRARASSGSNHRSTLVTSSHVSMRTRGAHAIAVEREIGRAVQQRDEQPHRAGGPADEPTRRYPGARDRLLTSTDFCAGTRVLVARRRGACRRRPEPDSRRRAFGELRAVALHERRATASQLLRRGRNAFTRAAHLPPSPRMGRTSAWRGGAPRRRPATAPSALLRLRDERLRSFAAPRLSEKAPPLHMVAAVLDETSCCTPTLCRQQRDEERGGARVDPGRVDDGGRAPSAGSGAEAQVAPVARRRPEALREARRARATPVTPSRPGTPLSISSDPYKSALTLFLFSTTTSPSSPSSSKLPSISSSSSMKFWIATARAPASSECLRSMPSSPPTW